MLQNKKVLVIDPFNNSCWFEVCSSFFPFVPFFSIFASWFDFLFLTKGFQYLFSIKIQKWFKVIIFSKPPRLEFHIFPPIFHSRLSKSLECRWGCQIVFWGLNAPIFFFRIEYSSSNNRLEYYWIPWINYKFWTEFLNDFSVRNSHLYWIAFKLFLFFKKNLVFGHFLCFWIF